MAREVDPPEDDEPAMQWILDTINGANDTCSKCAAPGGLTHSPKPVRAPFLFPFLVRRPSDPFRPPAPPFIWPCELLKGWLKHSSEFSGSFTRRSSGMRAEIFAGLINTTTIESFILNLLSQSRNSEEINFVETREYDLLYSSQDLLSLLDFPWLFRLKCICIENDLGVCSI
ncbi:hypothetical protein B0H13DRAFT_760195 [Mycena leptocephala]|nr:hypothetical protein B0H13DRAFT_760195 [Mycena leptocephala]